MGTPEKSAEGFEKKGFGGAGFREERERAELAGWGERFTAQDSTETNYCQDTVLGANDSNVRRASGVEGRGCREKDSLVRRESGPSPSGPGFSQTFGRVPSESGEHRG